MDSTVAAPLGLDDPQEIGPFRIIGLLGSGGMGEVYLGTVGEGYIAVKRVRPQLVSVERFKREVAILYQVPPGVAPSVWASDSTASRPWFATEYVPGLTLDEAVRLHGPLPAEALWLLLAEGAGRLSVVHKAAIVHRDLKPANVMLVRDGVKLIDFGIARAADQVRLTKDSSGYGTRGFTAPEQEAGEPGVAAPADVYSLGALLLFASAGRTPGADLDVEPLRARDAGLADVVESCLAKDPAARPAAADLVDWAREHAPEPDPEWPPAIMERIAAREHFAATPVGRMVTIPPPPMSEPVPPVPPVLSPVLPPVPPAPTPRAEGDGSGSGDARGGRRSRRTLLLVVPLALVVVVGGVTAFEFLPKDPGHSTARSAGTASAAASATDHATRSPSARPSSSPSPSADPVTSAPPYTTGPTSHSAAAPSQASSAATRGPAGPSGDRYYISGSEVSVPGCAGWVDFSGDLYVTVSAGAASCSADDIRSDSSIGGDGTTAIQAASYKEADSGGVYGYFGSYQFSEQVCVWNQADPAVKACSSKYTDNSGAESKG